MRVLFVLIALLFATEANAQRKTVGQFGDWYVVDYNIGSTNNCYASKRFTEFTEFAAMYIVQNINGSWVILLNKEFDDYLPNGDALRADLTIGKKKIKNLGIAINSSGAVNINFSRQSILAEELKKLPPKITIRFVSNESSETLEFNIPEMPQILPIIIDCVTEKRKKY